MRHARAEDMAEDGAEDRAEDRAGAPAAEIAAALRAEGFRGDLDADPAALAAAATDNSVYRILPQLVAAPRDAADAALLVRALSRSAFRGVGLTARGGGTGTNGQALNGGVIVDFRRHMHRILAVNAAEGWADVEPGVVLDALNAHLAPTGLFFAPETSTSSRCTIGGMVATDASGKGSRRFGKTSDNVLGLTAIVGDGLPVDSTRDALPAALERAVEAACDAGRAALLAAVPRLSRRFSGYDLERAVRGPGGFEWWRLFLGAEGTLGLVTRIRVRLVPRPRARRLVVAGFDRFPAALDAAQALLAHDPLAVECLDEWVQKLADEAGLLSDLPPALRDAGGRRPVFDFIECAGDDDVALDRQVAALSAALPGLPGWTGHHVARDPAEIARLWAIRSASVGLLGRSATARRPIAFVEDCVVPPERLSAFVAEFDALMRREGLAYGIYGHADVGCLHVRPALDIGAAEDRARLQRVSDAVFALVRRQGGIFWGEHGKGVRGQYLEEFVGPQAYAAFRRVKRAFDPGERYNPGKLVTLDRPPLRILSTPFRQPAAPPGDVLAKAFACNGNALCLSYAAAAPMCPSFKVSGDAVQSPKGRAEALKLWAAGRGGLVDAALEASVHRALDGCLGCKACASTCPVQVDVPEMKSHFLEAYHRRQPRSLSDRLAMGLERHGRLAALARPVASLPPVARLMRRAAARLGVVDAPALSRRGIGRLGMPALTPDQAAREAGLVLLAADGMTSLFDTPAIAQIGAGLRALGLRPAVLRLPPWGKAAHAKGDRPAFRAQAERLAAALDRAGAGGAPILGVDPAFTAMLSHEYRHAGLAPRVEVQAVQDFLLAQPLPVAPSGDGAPRRIFLHCMERARGQAAVETWERLGERLGIPFEVAATGCCGMAGTFGHEPRHQATSRALFDLSWAKPAAQEAVVHATGFSCRCQVRRFAGRPVAHPLALIAERFGER